MTSQTPKHDEIKRLTTPLTFKNFRAYDSNGKLLKCSETLSDVRFIIEPKENILNDDEILQYAPESKAASNIRLKRGVADMQDALLIHESLPWILALFYVALICIAIPVTYSKNTMGMYLILVLFIIPLIYLFFTLNLNRYVKKSKSKVDDIPQDNPKSEAKSESANKDTSLESLKRYEKEINNLKVLFNVKEEVVRDLIAKRFEPPQITYDKFISSVDSCHKLFYSQAESALSIINLAVDDTPRVQSEIKSKIDAMKKIINQIEDLTNELVINISSSDESTQEVENLLDNMENLIDSVKKY